MPSRRPLSSGSERDPAVDDMDKIVVDVVEIRVEQLIRENFLTVEHVFTARTCLNLAAGAALGSAAGAVTATAVAWAGSAVVSKWRKWREANDADDQDRKQPVKVSENFNICDEFRRFNKD